VYFELKFLGRKTEFKNIDVAKQLKISRLEPKKEVVGIHIFVYQCFKLFEAI